jgi:hypothetical protein
MVAMDNLPLEIVEHIISFACSDRFVLVSEEPVEVLCYDWEDGKWVSFWGDPDVFS